MPTKTKVQLPALFRANIGYSRKMGIYRASFLIGRRLASDRETAEAGLETQASRYYTANLKELTSVIAHWIHRNRNKEVK